MSFDIDAAERCKRPGLSLRAQQAHKRLWLVVAPGVPALVAAALARDAQDLFRLADEETHDAASAAIGVHCEAADGRAYLHAFLVDEHRVRTAHLGCVLVA